MAFINKLQKKKKKMCIWATDTSWPRNRHPKYK